MNDSSNTKEFTRRTVSGIFMAPLLIALFVSCLVAMIMTVHRTEARGEAEPATVIFIVTLLVVILFMLVGGLFGVQPNQAVVLTLFGRYAGSVREPGLRWVNPFLSKKRVSLRVRNFETTHLKVNDLEGNPIEIAAVVVWKIIDSAEALFQVDKYENYVNVQSEAALRNLATAYAYDSHEDGKMSLRGHTAEVAEHLKDEIHDRLKIAGVEVLESRISHLAYAPEIAAAMLQRQQASAIVAARTKIVEGAVGMVEMALERLNEKKVVELDEESKAAMVSNLLVVLCGERAAQPVVNAGTLHH
ncbi:MAG TPA: SPFH domain-containing protein [Bryobacteraceae bacterium]|jgi:regulator of protease activity HflC (stomatin/prohibitin superfamily)